MLWGIVYCKNLILSKFALHDIKKFGGKSCDQRRCQVAGATVNYDFILIKKLKDFFR